jgi:hypothetical protein
VCIFGANCFQLLTLHFCASDKVNSTFLRLFFSPPFAYSYPVFLAKKPVKKFAY